MIDTYKPVQWSGEISQKIRIIYNFSVMIYDVSFICMYLTYTDCVL